MKASFVVFVIAILVSCFSITAVAKKTCGDDSISSVSSDGDIIKMLSGSVLEIDDVRSTRYSTLVAF